MSDTMRKSFEPSEFEAKWQRHWTRKGFFTAEASSARPSFCIMIPPPNVTGRLHIGHALQSTLQDLFIRWKRMQGFNALWLPGTDHAGIATQLVVERQLEAEGLSRQEIGRERFLERLWKWTEEHHGNIREQLDQLGASCDWTRERFTLDEGLSRAVRTAFVRLHAEGLIYRGEYMVNWSPGLETAISDLEVEMRPLAGKLYHIAYPLRDSDERIVVATTRPETMLGDTAVALHPGDERYRHLLGAEAVLPLVGRKLRFVADEAVDPEFGTGLVKVTPAHDPTDFEIGQRHDLPRIQVIERRGRMTPEAGEDYAGLDRFEARRRIVEALAEQGFLVAVEEHEHNVGHCQRSGVPIEPLISMQWFADVSGMAQAALEAVRRGDLELVPDTWDRTWEHWLENIKPWCISRQLWWGHQIPAWYREDGECFVAVSEEEAAKVAGTRALTRDPDVLDTWFSSALWPFSTLGWPEATPDLETFYPTDLLVTGFDILFFWVARMVMSGLHFTGRVPFRTVHLTGLVRDAQGRKMSKTRGNTIDPLDLVQRYGADALRFTLAALDSPGRDVPLDPERMAGYRAFGNKIWNAVRFALARVGDAEVQQDLSTDGLAAPERWILSRLSRVTAKLDEKLSAYRVDEACRALYHFFWGELCDWYIELSKPALSGETPRPRVAEVLLSVLDRSLRLLHPVMPFLTEELWQRLPGHERIHEETICLAPYPERRSEWEDAVTEARMEWFMEVVSRVRKLRGELGVAPATRLRLTLRVAEAERRGWLEAQLPLATFLCRLERVAWGEPPEGSMRDAVAGLELGLELPPGAGEAGEVRRLGKEATDLETRIARLEALLADPQFLAKAPAPVVERNRQRLAELGDRLETLRTALGR